MEPPVSSLPPRYSTDKLNRTGFPGPAAEILGGLLGFVRRAGVEQWPATSLDVNTRTWREVLLGMLHHYDAVFRHAVYYLVVASGYVDH